MMLPTQTVLTNFKNQNSYNHENETPYKLNFDSEDYVLFKYN